MTDQIPADAVREIAEKMHHHASQEHVRRDAERYFRIFANQLDDLLPPPPTPPTLADMTREERDECKWMQADTKLWGRVVIVLHNAGGGRAVTLNREGHMAYEDHGTVTPRPDLPRMEWPGTGQDGEEVTKVDYVSVAGGRTAYGPWTVARLRKKPDTVPLNTLATGIVWDDADALAQACRESESDQIVVVDKRGIVGVWDGKREGWRASVPNSDFAPFTIIHTGKKADQ